MTADRSETAVPYVRVWVVLDEVRRHVYSVTSDEAKSIRDLEKVMSLYDGNPLCASRTVAVVDVPPHLVHGADSDRKDQADGR